MGIVSQTNLDSALAEQARTGQLLGEILVSTYGVSRVDLADALAAQWEEAQSLQSADPPADGIRDEEADQLAEGDLHILLEEAQAARVELTARTDELSRRLASLEALVIGVSDALDELRGSAPRPTPQPETSRAPSRGRSHVARSQPT